MGTASEKTSEAWAGGFGSWGSRLPDKGPKTPGRAGEQTGLRFPVTVHLPWGKVPSVGEVRPRPTKEERETGSHRCPPGDLCLLWGFLRTVEDALRGPIVAVFLGLFGSE